MPQSNHFSAIRTLFLMAITLAIGCSLSMAQSPSTNTNVLPDSPDEFTGDFNRQRQTEPAVAGSTIDPDVLFSSFIDYRTVRDQGDPNAATHSEAWLGCSRSFDRGRTWFGCMVPGFDGDTSEAGLASPLRGLTAGGDPILAPGTNGWFHLGGLFFDRGGYSTVAVVRYKDEPRADGGDRIHYKDAHVIDRGSASDNGNFTDKPAIVADIPRDVATGVDPLTACGPVYFAFTIFNGNSGSRFNTKVGFSRSMDCGDTWSNVQYVNKSYSQNQGTAMAVDPNSGKIYLVWRHVQDGKKPHSILMVTSTDRGQTFTSPVEIAQINPFDQPALSGLLPTFRSNAFPAIAVDGKGRVYVAIQERKVLETESGFSSPRIILRTSADGFATGTPIEQGPAYAHQIFPQLSYAAGQLMAMWVDFRGANAEICPACSSGEALSNGGWISGYERKMNMRAARAMADDAWTGAFQPSVQVSQYLVDASTGKVPVVPGTEDEAAPRAAVNWANLKMYVGGTKSFIGDYNWLTSASPFAREDNAWRWATKPTDYGAQSRYAVWYDNRDVVFPTQPTSGDNLRNDLGWMSYQSPGTGCSNSGSRNGNVYFSEIRPGVIVSSPALTRRLVDDGGTPVERSLPMYVENPNPTSKFFELNLETSSSVAGSFERLASTQWLQVEIRPYSTFTTNVYMLCSAYDSSGNTGCDLAHPARPLTVTVREITSLTGYSCAAPSGQPACFVSGGLSGSLTFNADPSSTAGQGLGGEAYGAGLKFLQFSNLQFSNAQWSNAQWSNAQFSNAQYSNAQYSNAQYSNLQFSNAQYSNAPDGDFIWEATNTGNNTTSFASVIEQADPDNACPGCQYEVIVSRAYQTPEGCTGQVSQDQIISVIQNAQFSNAQFSNAQFSNAQWSNAQWSNAQFSNASFASSPLSDSTAGKSAMKMASVGPPSPIGVGVPRGPDKVYIILRVYAPDGFFGGSCDFDPGTTLIPDCQIDSPVGKFLGQLAHAVYAQGGGQMSSDKGFTTTEITENPNCVADEACTVRVTVSPNDAGVTGTVKVTGANKGPDGQYVVDPSVKCQFDWPAASSCELTFSSGGDKKLTATYLGNLHFNPSIGTLETAVKWPTATAITSPFSTLTLSKGQTSYTVSWAVTAPGTVNEGTVTVSDGSGGTCTAAVGAGKCDLPAPSPVGTQTVSLTATYSGGPSFAGSTGTATPTIKWPTVVTITAPPSTLTLIKDQTEYTVSWTVALDGGAAVSDGKVTVSDGVYSCEADLPVSECKLPATFAAGARTVTLTASYAGGSNSGPGSATSASTVVWPTETAITSGAATVAAGGTYTATWNVKVPVPPSGPAVDQGTVTVTGGPDSCSAPVTDGKCTLTFTSTGAVTLTASYSGGANFTSSSSSAGVTITVAYRFVGFHSPLTTATLLPGDASDSGSRQLSAGLPIKWSLYDGSGALVTDTGSLTNLWALSCDGARSILLYDPTLGAKGGSVFRFATDHFAFNWDTNSGELPGCYIIKADISDGNSYATRVQLQ